MPWVKLDDRFPSHRKIALLSDRAFRLHVSALCWCAENLTDGHITDRELPLVAKIRGMKATAKALEDAGLWDRVEDGWIVHDYLDYNPSREQVIAERKKNAERQERHRRRRNGKPLPPDSSQTPETHDGDTTATRRRHDGDTTTTRNRSVPETYQQVSEFRNGVTNDAPSRPVPTRPLPMADVGEGSTSSRALPAQRSDDRLAPIDVDGFALNDGMRRWAHRDGYAPLVDIDYETAQFIDHFRSNGQHRRNWNDEWQKWIRRAHKWAVERQQQRGTNVIALPTGQTLTGTDARVAGWLALADELAQENQ